MFLKTLSNYMTLEKVRIASVYPGRRNKIRLGDPKRVRIVPGETLNAHEKVQFKDIEDALKRPEVHREITSDIMDMGVLYPGDSFVLRQMGRTEAKDLDLFKIIFPAQDSPCLEMRGDVLTLEAPHGNKLSLFSDISLFSSGGRVSLISYLRKAFPSVDFSEIFFSIENQGAVIPGTNGPEVIRPASEKGVLLDAGGEFSEAWLNSEIEGFLFDYHVHPGLGAWPSDHDFTGKFRSDRFEIPADNGYDYFAPQLVFDRIGRCAMHASKIFRPYHPSMRRALIHDFQNSFFIRAEIRGFELK